MRIPLYEFGNEISGQWQPAERIQDSMTRTRGNTVSDLPAIREVHQFTADCGTVYRIEITKPDILRTQHPAQIRGCLVDPSGEFLTALPKPDSGNVWKLVHPRTGEPIKDLQRAEGYHKLRNRVFCEVEFPDGSICLAVVSKETPPALEGVEAVTLAVENRILSECDHPRYSKITSPNMREFYTQYVIHRWTLKKISEHWKCSKNTIIQQRKKRLQDTFFTFHGIHVDLKDFRSDLDLREARRKRDNALKVQADNAPKRERRLSDSDASAWEDQTTYTPPPKKRNHL